MFWWFVAFKDFLGLSPPIFFSSKSSKLTHLRFVEQKNTPVDGTGYLTNETMDWPFRLELSIGDEMIWYLPCDCFLLCFFVDIYIYIHIYNDNKWWQWCRMIISVYVYMYIMIYVFFFFIYIHFYSYYCFIVRRWGTEIIPNHFDDLSSFYYVLFVFTCCGVPPTFRGSTQWCNKNVWSTNFLLFHQPFGSLSLFCGFAFLVLIFITVKVLKMMVSHQLFFGFLYDVGNYAGLSARTCSSCVHYFWGKLLS